MGPSVIARGTRHRRSVLLAVGFAAALLLLAAPQAHAFIYWSNFGNADRTTIGRADDDGLNLNSDFVTGANAPCGVAVDDHHLYWANYGMGGGASSIGRSDLDGNNLDQSFIPLSASAVCGVAVDTSHLYWTATGHGSGGAVGQADLAGTSPNESFIGGTTGPCGVAVNTNNIFWANNGNGTIGRSDRAGGNVNQAFISGSPSSEPCGVDANDTNVFWANFNDGTIGRAQVDGGGVNQSFITGADHPCGVAIDGAHVYWANFSSGTIGRADLDGNNVDQAFMTFPGNPCGIAVTHTPPPPTPPGPPFNDFGFKRVKKNHKTGTAKLVLNLPGAGSVAISGQGVRPVTKDASAAGLLPVKIGATGAARAQLESDGRVRVTIVATFTPSGGDARSKSKRITLLLKL